VTGLPFEGIYAGKIKRIDICFILKLNLLPYVPKTFSGVGRRVPQVPPSAKVQGADERRVNMRMRHVPLRIVFVIQHVNTF
jgi:hypothetical protein